MSGGEYYNHWLSIHIDHLAKKGWTMLQDASQSCDFTKDVEKYCRENGIEYTIVPTKGYYIERPGYTKLINITITKI